MNACRHTSHVKSLARIGMFFLPATLFSLIPESSGLCDPGDRFSVEWSTYLGGSGSENGIAWAAIAMDHTLLVAGNTNSQDFPSFAIPPETRRGVDVFVGRFSPAGHLLQTWFLGGSGDDRVLAGPTMDGQGNLLLTGSTASSDFPTTGSYDNLYHGGGSGWGDAYLTKIAPDGRILWSTYLGGRNGDYGWHLALDSEGNIYVTGMTMSDDFPTSGGYGRLYNGGTDSFIAKFSASGRLRWSAYLGGSGEDLGYGVAVDDRNDIYVGGRTTSTNFPTTGTRSMPFHGGTYDGFLVKVSSNGSLIWSTCWGGTGSDDVADLVWDPAGFVHLTGQTGSIDFPTSGGRFNWPMGGMDCHLSEIRSDGSLARAYLLGGAGSDAGAAVSPDDAREVHLAGATMSGDFPTTAGGNTTFRGAWDVFVAKFNGRGDLRYAGYLGGSQSEFAYAVPPENSEDVFYVVGRTSSADFPTTNGWDKTCDGGAWEGFVTKIGTGAPSTGPIITAFPPTIRATVVRGESLSSRTLQIWNRGAATLNYDLDSTPSILIGVTPASGVSSGARVNHSVSLRTTSLAVGRYTGRINITGNGANSPTSVPIEISIVPQDFVKDIYAGATASSPQNLADVNGTLFFSAADAANGRELWKSDGTSAQTLMVRNIAQSSVNSDPAMLVNLNGMLLFAADDGIVGRELWRSNGTPGGTALVRNINPSGILPSNPQYLTVIGGTVFFNATDIAIGAELWKSDGTTNGTVLVKDIRPGGLGSGPSYLVNAGGTLLFSGDNGANGAELYRSDGTASGTVLVKDIYPGLLASSPQVLTAIGGTVFFSADNGTQGRELWKSDGTATGTTMLKDIYSGLGGASPQTLTVVNETLYFSALGTGGRELWKSDGTATGTTRVKDINAAGDSNPMSLTNVYGTLFFSADDGVNGRELWRSDGTNAGTVMVRDIIPGLPASSPTNLTGVFGTLYFTAYDRINGIELWRSDGTVSGTVLVRDIWPGINASSPAFFTAINNTLFFSAAEDVHGAELWSVKLTPPWMIQEPVATGGTQNTVYWSAGIGSTTYRVQRDDAPDFLTPLQTVDVSSPTLSHAFTSLTAGRTYWYRVRVRDAAGTWTAWSGPTFSTQDTVPPTVTLTSPAPAWTNTSPIPVTVTFSEAVTGLTAGGITCANGAVTGLSGFGANYSCYLTPTSQGQVTAQIAAGRAQDAAELGNTASAVLSRNFDGLPPTGPASLSDGGAFTSSTSVRFDWPAATDAGSGLASYDLQIGTTPSGTELFNAGVGLLRTFVIAASDGQTVYGHVRARDTAGNTGAWTHSDGITVDRTRPSLQAAGAPDYMTVNATFSEAVLNANQASNYTCNRGIRILAALPTGNPRQFCLYTTAQTPGTSYTLTVAASTTDRAHNPIDPARRSATFVGGPASAVRQWQLYRPD